MQQIWVFIIKNTFTDDYGILNFMITSPVSLLRVGFKFADEFAAGFYRYFAIHLYKPGFLRNDISGSEKPGILRLNSIFLFISANHGIVPIEVKSGDSSRLKSLQLFMQKSPSEISIRFWGNHDSRNHLKTPSGKAFTLFNLPYNYAGFKKDTG